MRMALTDYAVLQHKELVAPPPSASPSPPPLCGPRGTRQRRCRGEVLVMLGHYGWIAAAEDIDHPDADKNGGRIYVHKRDANGPLLAGDVVDFYLYADGQGLGAEACRVVQPASSNLSANAPEFAQATTTT